MKTNFLLMYRFSVMMLIIGLHTSVFCQTESKPNFIFIILDDGNDWLQGYNGHPQAQTKNINFLEKRGTTFLNAYCSAPQCAPSRTSLISGKDCYYTQVYHNQYLKCSSFRDNFKPGLGNEVVYTIPQILKDSGNYFTYSISKVMHCHDNYPDYDIDNPDMCARALSWSKALTLPDTYGEMPVVYAYGVSHEMGVYEYPYCAVPDSMEQFMEDYIATDSAISFLHDYSLHPDNYCDKPFFLALGYRRPHNPLYIPEKYFLPYHNEDYYSVPYDIPYDVVAGAPYTGVVMPPQPDPVWSDYAALPDSGVAHALVEAHPVHEGVLLWSAYMQYTEGLPEIMAGLSDVQRQWIMQESKRANMVMAYLASLKYVDAQIGRLIAALKAHPDIMNNTVVVLISDHGFSLGEKTHWKKSAMWETDIRSPLIITDFRAPVKRISPRTVSFLDLFPTFLDLADVPAPQFPDGSPYLDGYSLTPLLANPMAPWTRPVISAFKNGKDPAVQGSCFVQYSVRDASWHYIRYETNGDDFPEECDDASGIYEEELYHIGANRNIDPNEWNNLADDPGYAYIKDYLSSFLPGEENYLQFAKEAEPAEEDISSLQLLVYPNPTSGISNVVLRGSVGDAHITLLDALGNIIMSTTIVLDADGAMYAYDLQGLPAGLYFLHLAQGMNDTGEEIMVIH
ncbi:MAG: sulfatase-like hydrolase/transferase [Chitinophagales bacterium]